MLTKGSSSPMGLVYGIGRSCGANENVRSKVQDSMLSCRKQICEDDGFHSFSKIDLGTSNGRNCLRAGEHSTLLYPSASGRGFYHPEKACTNHGFREVRVFAAEHVVNDRGRPWSLRSWQAFLIDFMLPSTKTHRASQTSSTFLAMARALK